MFGPTAATGHMVTSASTPALHQKDLDGDTDHSTSPSKLKKSLSRFSFLLAAQEEHDQEDY